MLDPHNLWVYNSTSPANSELPTGASSSGYKPGHQVDATSPLKLAANTTTGVTDSYISDTFINKNLANQSLASVQLTADGNITVTSNVSIFGNSTPKLMFQANKDTKNPLVTDNTGHIVINNATINVTAGVQVAAQGNLTINRSKLTTEKDLTIAASKKVSISNSNLSGSVTRVIAMQGDLEITGVVVNGTTSVSMSSAMRTGNSTLSGVSVNTPDVTVGGSNITLNNANLNVTPSAEGKGIKLGTATTKNVVIKNSTLNTTGVTPGVINIQGSTANAAINANGLEPDFSLSFHSQ